MTTRIGRTEMSLTPLAVIRHWFTIFVVLLSLGVIGCATGPLVVNHSFEFDLRRDSPDIQLLDYRYGTSRHPGARPPDWALKEGKIAHQVGITGDMILGDTLYAKWRVKSTGEVFEDTVDLKSRLPADMAGYTIMFVIKGNQLLVYLGSPELRPKEFPAIGPKKWQYYKVYSIYPDSTLEK